MAAALAPGRILGRYEMLAPIARGGMAEVWAARLHGTRGFQRVVALKTIDQETMDDARMEQMLLQEASLASRIQHPMSRRRSTWANKTACSSWSWSGWTVSR